MVAWESWAGWLQSIYFSDRLSKILDYIQLYKLDLKINCIMLRMQNVFLRSMNAKLSLKYAFSKLKINQLQITVASNIPPEPANIMNKALYLDYVQQVLKDKQADLVRLENQLIQKENQLHQQDYKKGVGQMIVQMESIKLIEKKLKNIQEKMGIRDEEYLMLYRKFESDCAKSKSQMEEVFKKQYSDLINQRTILRNKLSQFAELESYQKYLNQLHNALEVKSQQLAEKQSMISQEYQQLQNAQNTVYETAGKQTDQSNNSNRKRIKIFSTKPRYPSQQHPEELLPEQHSSHQQQTHHNQTFARWQQQDRSSLHHPQHQSSHQKAFRVDQSSAILEEQSKYGSGYYNRMDQSKEEASIQKDYASSSKPPQTGITTVDTVDFSVQVDSENLIEAGDRLRKQSVILRLAKKWMKHTFDSNKTSITKKKLMAVNLWKMNACFDENISQRAINSIESLEKVWRKQEKLLYEAKMFPYNELSLKRRKYAELMFDLQQKIYQRKRVQNLLKSIFTHRHRKQRLIFYMYFCRFIKNSSNPEKAHRGKQKSKFGQTVGTTSGAHLANRSDIISMTSSHILQEDHINLPKKKSTASLVSNKSQLISKQTSTQKLSHHNYNPSNKQNSNQSKNQQIEKLKQIINDKQRTQKLLATQCVKLEGLIKICMLLGQSTFKTHNYAMRKIVESQYYDKIGLLEDQLNGLEFKFDLVMTKCKLGVANNSNKISTLENLLEFTNLIK